MAVVRPIVNEAFYAIVLAQVTKTIDAKSISTNVQVILVRIMQVVSIRLVDTFVRVQKVLLDFIVNKK